MAGGVALAGPEAGGPWRLPEGWCWAPAGLFADIVGGGTPANASDPANFAEAGIPWITPADLSGYTAPTITAGARSLSELGFQRSSAQMLPAGSLLISSRAPVGYCAVVARSLCTNQGFKSLRFKIPVDPFFLRHFVIFAKTRLNDAASGTTFKELSGRAMAEILFPLAPLAEQRRIVARIDALFAEIAEGEAALAAARDGLETFRRALLKAAVTGELTEDWRKANSVAETGHDLLAGIALRRSSERQRGRARRTSETGPIDTSDLPDLPEGWAWATLDQVKSGRQRNGISIAGSASPPGVKAMRLDALTSAGLDLEAVRYIPLAEDRIADYQVNAGDLLVSRANGSAELVGRAVYVQEIAEPVVFPDTMIRYPLGTDPTIGRWMETAWNSPLGRSQIRRLAKTTAGILKISQEDISQIALPIPPSAEMAETLRRVSEALSACTDTLGTLDAEAADAARLKQSILKAAFEGRLVPQDPADEPASALLARLSAPAPEARRGRGARTRAK